MRIASDLLAMGADVADGKVPSPAEAAKFIFGAACTLGCAEELKRHLTSEAVDRVDAEVEAAIREKVDGDA